MTTDSGSGGSSADVATPDQPPQAEARPIATESANRIASLDFIRGLAVMGILLANIVAFGQPFTAYMYPDAFLTPHGDTEDAMWIAQFILIDGKMRALFTLLFGAGLYLFMERAWARGATRWLQTRRLLWLGLFGLVHYLFIWTGDILFLYAVSGLLALLFLKLSRRKQFVIGVIGYILGGLIYLGFGFSMEAAADGSFAPDAEAAAEMQEDMRIGKQTEIDDAAETGELIASGNYAGYVAKTVAEAPVAIGAMLLLFWFETLPLMLIGVALYRKGMFSGGMGRDELMLWGAILFLLGGALTALVAFGVQEDGFTYWGTLSAFLGWSHFPRGMMGVGLLALLALWAANGSGWLYDRVSAAGRAAFTNYLGTSVLMLFVFHGWAGGLFGELTRGQLYLVVLATWAIMLAWSKPWLDRYRYGPLEWLWRCLTYGKIFPNRRTG